MKILVTRDSVCAGDDCDAPHALSLDVDPNATLRDVLASLTRPRYLAGIQGGMATWVAESGEPLAIVCEQHPEPWFLFDPETLASELFPARTLYFHYLAQIDPQFVLEQLAESPQAM